MRWDDLLARGVGPAPGFVRLPFDHPLYILYSSGTTGLPKCMVHSAGGTLLQHLKEHRLHVDLRQAERLFYFTTCGWMMWNWQVSALAAGATLVLYDGAPLPAMEPGLLWRLAAEESVNVFGTSAKYLALAEKSGLTPRDTRALPALRAILSTGSPLAAESFDWVHRAVGPDVQVSSISGGTDIVSCFVLGNPLSPVYRGEIQGPGLGMAVAVYDEAGAPSPVGEAGELVCEKPFPAMPIVFWNDPDAVKYQAAYFERFPGVWCHGDWVARTGHGGFVIQGRSDATLNPGGVRIGTAEIYRQVELLPSVVESLVVGQRLPGAPLGDERIVLFVRLRQGALLDDALQQAIRQRIRAGTSPHHVPRVIVQVADLPRTRSGKLSELAVRDTIEGRPVKNVGALANPESLLELQDRPELHG
jgi:acetoacetyl-CoA synthetase